MQEQMIKIKDLELQKVYEIAKQRNIEETKQKEMKFEDKLDGLNMKLNEIDK
jgi:hypothetical protein